MSKEIVRDGFCVIPHHIDEQGEFIDGTWYKNAKVINFEDKSYVVSDKAVLTITATSICNAKCKFCYNNITYTPKGRYVDIHCHEFQRTLEFCRSANIKIAAISGGEPTLEPIKLLEMLELIKNDFKFIRIHTNGSNLLKKVLYNGLEKSLWQHISDYKMCQISISLVHYCLEKNRKIMNLDIDIFQILEQMKEQVNTRLSCYLDEAGIKLEDVCKYIDMGLRYNVKEYIFRFSTDIPEDACLDSACTRNNKLAEQDIDMYAKVLQDYGFVIDVYEKKTDSIIYILRRDDIKVDLSKSGEENDPDKKIRRVLYMPDDKTYYSWINLDSKLL